MSKALSVMSVCSTINQKQNAKCSLFNTVQREGKSRKEKGIHIHWHVNIQADGICSWDSVINLIDKLGTNLGHKTSIPILGSKQWLNLQGQHKTLAGSAGPSPNSCRDAHRCLLSSEERSVLQSQRAQETTWKSAAPWALSFLHRAALAKDSSHE